MISFIARLWVKKEKTEEFERLQIKLAELTHEHEPGTSVYDFIKHKQEAGCYVVYARFKDEAAFQAHQASPFHEDLVPDILACLAGDMDLQFFESVA